MMMIILMTSIRVISLNPGNTTWVGELGPSFSMVAVYTQQN